MMRRLPLAFVVLLCAATGSTSAQSLHPTAALEAPSTLACDATATATLTLARTVNPAVEFMFVVDESGSVSTTVFNNSVRPFMLDVTRGLLVGPDAARVGVVQFATSARLSVQLQSSASGAQSMINSLTLLGGNTCIGCGIELADQYLEANARPGVPRVMLVITDGRNSVNTDTLASVAAAARAHGTTILAVGVGDVDQSELFTIASSIAGLQTVFMVNDFSQLAAIRNTIVSVLPSATTTGIEIDLTVSPEFDVLSATANPGGVSVPRTGNAIRWTIAQQTVDSLALSLRRASVAPGSIPVFTATRYTDAQGREFTMPNAVVSFPECGGEDAARIAELEAQVADLMQDLSDVQAELVSVGNQLETLTQQNAQLQSDNDALRMQLAAALSPSGTMYGVGQIPTGETRGIFMVNARRPVDGLQRAALQYVVCQPQTGQPANDVTCLMPLHKFAMTQFTAVIFSNDPGVVPSPDPQRAGWVDSLRLTGFGKWNGADGYAVDLTAVDRGDIDGPNTDTFSIVVTAPDGTVVLSASGPLAGGNLEAYAY